MSVPTTPAYILNIDSVETPREHPVVDFLYDHQEAFDHGDMKNQPYTKWQTEDFVLTKPDGTVLPPGEASFKAWVETYAPFTEHLHQARYICVYERNGVWEMFVTANIFADLVVPGKKTRMDLSGRRWDVVIPGSVFFTFVADRNGPKGFLMKSMTIHGDVSIVLSEMIKRGMVKPEDLAK